MRHIVSLVLLSLGSACTGWLSPRLAEGQIDIGGSPLRRLTRAELAASLSSTFTIDPGTLIETMLPDITAERGNPFDNDHALQDISTAYVQGLVDFAERYGELVAANRSRVDALAGCAPRTIDDAACLDAFVRKVGRLLLRRDLADDDAALFVTLIDEARVAGDYYVGVAAVVQALVTHPETIFRAEPGAFGVASRLAFLVWGSAPDGALLELAARDELADPVVRRAEAQRLYGSPRARAHWRRFHAQWLGYADRLPEELATDLLLETETVIDAVTHDDPELAWFDLFTLDRSYLTPALAEHYALGSIDAPSWVRYSGKRGGGVLAHGLFLQQGAKFGDTSPTLRGYRLWKRVFCGELGAPPTDVDTDVPPAGTSPSDCKSERYTMRQDAACASCHAVTDGIGFGLENFGATGAWRDTETNNPACAIGGAGEVLGEDYSGPAELGSIIAASGDALSCGARQLFRFASGRTEVEGDESSITAIARVAAEQVTFRQLILAIVENPSFINERE